jgi:hypothetical protein
MPVVLKIDPHRRVVYSTFYGKITDDEVLDHRSRIATDADFKPHFNEIVDFSAVTEAEVSERTLAALAANPSLYAPSSLHILVVPSNPILQFVSRFRELAAPTRPNLFIVRTRAEAYSLLPE